MTAFIGGAITALFFTGSILSSTRATRMVGPVATLAGVMLVSAVVSAPIVVLTTLGTPFPSEALLWLFLAGAGNVGGLLSEYIGLRTGKVGVVGALAAAEGAVSAVLSVIAGEVLAPMVGVGVAIVAVGVTLTALSPDPEDVGSSTRRIRSAVLFGAIAGLAFGVSLYATNTSSISYIAIPAKAFETDWQYIMNKLITILGLMFVAVWIVPLLHRER